MLGFLPSGVTSAEQVVDHLTRTLLVVDLDPRPRQTLVEFLAPLPPAAEWPKQRDKANARFRGLLTLLVSTPEFQVN